MIVVIDYGMGNLRSAQKGVEKGGHAAIISDSPDSLVDASGIILPGVGAFKDCFDGLTERGFVGPLLSAVKAGTPLLGICVGMQMLFEHSDEGEGAPGLGILPGNVVRFPDQSETGLKVPHMGWNRLDVVAENPCPLLKHLTADPYVYFVHSYHPESADSSVVYAESTYGAPFPAVVGKGNVYGTQFHPEKSQAEGIGILSAFGDFAVDAQPWPTHNISGGVHCMSKRSSVEKVVAKLGDLPAMPDVVTGVMELTSNANVAVSEVSALIERDPALTAKLLKVSNSSYYGMRQVVGTLKLALVILGVREVRNIVVGISVLESLKDATTEKLLVREGLWNHSTQVASYSKKLGSHLEFGLRGEDFIAGLLHDIGKLVLWKQMNEEYVDVYKAAQDDGIPLHELEFEQFGFDHADAASAVAEAWALPETLSNALRCHHPRSDRALKDSKDSRLSALVRVANLAANDDLLAEDRNPESLASCNEEEAWSILTETFAMDGVYARYELLKSFASEMQGAPELTF